MISLLYVLTLGIAMITTVFFMSGPVYRVKGCSAFYSDANSIAINSTVRNGTYSIVSANQVVGELIERDGIVAAVASFFQNRYTLIGIILVSTTFIYQNRIYHEAFLDYFQEKTRVSDSKTALQEKELKALRKENRFPLFVVPLTITNYLPTPRSPHVLLLPYT